MTLAAIHDETRHREYQLTGELSPADASLITSYSIVPAGATPRRILIDCHLARCNEIALERILDGLGTEACPSVALVVSRNTVMDTVRWLAQNRQTSGPFRVFCDREQARTWLEQG